MNFNFINSRINQFSIWFFRVLPHSRKLRSVIFKTADNDTEKEATYRLRYQVYCIEKRYLPASQYPLGLEKDEYDDRPGTFSLTAIGKKGDILGMLRIVMNDNNHKQLPSEKYFALNNYKKNHRKVAELTRFIITPEYRKNVAIYFGLVKLAIIFAKQKEISNYCISVSTRFRERYKRLGFVEVSGPYYYSQIQHEHPSITMCIDLLNAYRLMKSINPVFARYLQSELPTIIQN